MVAAQLIGHRQARVDGAVVFGEQAEIALVPIADPKVRIIAAERDFLEIADGAKNGLIVHRRGVLPALWICGLIQMASNLIFVVQAWVGRDLGMLAVTISAENLAGGMGTTAFVAYLSSLCNLSYTATQYALLSSFMAQARTTLSAAGGFIAASTSWVGFFLITTLAAVPGLVLLLLLQRRLGGAMAARPQPGIVVEPG